MFDRSTFLVLPLFFFSCLTDSLEFFKSDAMSASADPSKPVDQKSIRPDPEVESVCPAKDGGSHTVWVKKDRPIAIVKPWPRAPVQPLNSRFLNPDIDSELED